MIAVPKLAVLLLIIAAVWYVMRWMNGPARHVQQRRRRPPPPSPVPRPIATEELVACERCGTYVSAAALHCGRPGCPRPRP